MTCNHSEHHIKESKKEEYLNKKGKTERRKIKNRKDYSGREMKVIKNHEMEGNSNKEKQYLKKKLKVMCTELE